MAASLWHVCVSTTKCHFIPSTLTRCMYPFTHTYTRNSCISNVCMKFGKRCYSNGVDFFGLEENECSDESRISADLVSRSERKSTAKNETKYSKSNKSVGKSQLPQDGNELIRETPFGSIRYDGNPADIVSKLNAASGLENVDSYQAKRRNLLSNGTLKKHDNKKSDRHSSSRSGVQNSFIDDQYFPNVGEKKPVASLPRVSDAPSNSATKPVEINKSDEDLSYVDEQYFSHSESSSLETSSSPDNLGESEESYVLHQDNDNDLSYIDSNFIASKDNGNHDNRTDISRTKPALDSSFIDEQYFEYSGRDAKIDKQTEFSNTDRVTVTADDNDSIDMQSFTDEQYFGNNKDGNASETNEILSNLNQRSKQKEKQTKLTKFNFNVKEMDKNESDEKGESVHSVSKRIRTENERKTKSMLYGKYDPGEYDSKGFRILTGQVPNFYNIPSIDIVKVLRENIIYDDNDILAITKPYGLPSHGGPGVQNSVGQLLNDILPSQELHHVHRLDKETTGVMLFGKTYERAKQLRKLFAQREIKKRYYVITKNIPSLPAGMIDIPMCEGTVGKMVRMVLRPYTSSELDPIMKKRQPGKEAKTEYNVLDQGEECALIECRPLTGLKHQIRVHLSFGLNCPILGDHKYSHVDKMAPMRLHPKMLKQLKIQQSKVRTLAMHLHARSILIPEFQDGKNLFISAPLPLHFVKNMRDLKLRLPRGK